MSSTITIGFTLLLGLAVLPHVVDSQPNVQIRNGQFFSRFKCPNNGNKVVCASDKPAKAYNSSSREQCCANCHNLGWSWFNFIDNEDQTKSVGGVCQLFDKKPKIVIQKTRCSLYKSDSIQLNPTDIISICNAVVIIMDRPNTTSSWNLPWSSYKYGFNLADGGYWLGLELVHQLTSLANYRLLVEFLCSGASVWTSVQYKSFVIGDEVNTNYTLSVSGFVGSAGDYLTFHNGLKFSTSDSDNDLNTSGSCTQYGGGWWFVACFSVCFPMGIPPYTCWKCSFTALRMSIILNQ